MTKTISQIIKIAYPVIVVLSIVGLIGISFYSAILTFRTTSKEAAEMDGDEMVTAWEKRLRKLRLILPDHGVIGYLADWDIPDYQYGDKDQEVEFILAQYTVAPLVLERGINHDLILGNFNDNGDPQKIQGIQNYFGIQLQESFSNEFFIFKGKGQ
jgi:hypothetical protein